MESLLFAREVGGFAGNKQAQTGSIQHSIGSSDALIRRLTNHKQLDITGGGCVGALCCSWDDAGVQLAVGTDTCQLLIYNADKGQFTHKFDPVSNVRPATRQHGAPGHPVQTCLTVLLLSFTMWSCRAILKALLAQNIFLGLMAGFWSQLDRKRT
jgi:hypothetical protein